MQDQTNWHDSPYLQRARTILLNGEDIEVKRLEILNYFQQTFTQYEDLFSLLNCDKAYYALAEPLRHPLIFYFGHTATFYINKFILMKIISQRIDPTLESKFAVGVDEMSWDDLQPIQQDWPTVFDIQAYRQKVYASVTQVITDLPLTLPIRWEDPAWIILMCIEHERIHLETSSMLMRQLPLEFVTPNDHWPACPLTNNAPQNVLIDVPGGQVTLGKSSSTHTYGWDNEYGNVEFTVEDFAASRFLVSNQEFLTFVEEAGYQTQKWWTEEGWNWRNYAKAVMPRFWLKQNNLYSLRLVAEVVPMPWDWPVEVNYLEAKAFCHWLMEKKQAPIRLPTEAEWYVLRKQITEEYPNWQQAVGNIDLSYYASACAVNQFKQGEFYDIVGNVWQWTETIMNSYPGFNVHPAYDDFSIPTFDGKHNLLKGGSWISTGNEATKESRYAFRRHFYQHAGFRYVKSEQSPHSDQVYYQTDRLLSEYLEFHFGKTYFAVANYPKAMVEIALSAFNEQQPRLKVLDLGCAVGRSSFELAKYFAEVYGIDFSARFINAAVRLQEEAYIKYAITDEGDLCEYRECHLTELGLFDEDVKKIQFLQGDACNLQPALCGFDLILASNLIDRLYDPILFLQSIHERLNVGGILLISSPYTWLEEHTDRTKWLGGVKQDGETLTTLARMQMIFKNHFESVGAPRDVEFVIRETKRKFQHSVAEVTLWRRII